MGAVLATPGKRSGKENMEQNNNLHNQHSPTHFEKKVPFSRLNIVHECFPALGKENKFLNEKVPAYWTNKKSSKKKSKQKTFFQDPYTQNINNNIVIKTKRTHEPINVIPIKNEKHKLTLNKIYPDTNKHFYGTLNLSETLKYIGCYVYLRCRNMDGLRPSVVVGWIRSVDRNLILSGWQEMGFISQPNMIVLYMLLREVIPSKVRSIDQLKAMMMSTLYMCYAYNGHEISYPLKPFLLDGDRRGFWDRCMAIISDHSDKLLAVNKDAKFYNDIQLELKVFGKGLESKGR